MVVDTYDGSLKAEHGTGRNMAPFVELEWGAEAYALMQEIKPIFDPEGLLNPGVILNPRSAGAPQEPETDAGVRHESSTSASSAGSASRSARRGLTLSPRQRIVGWREIARLAAAGDGPALRASYEYPGIDTCAACGLCATACPVGIETGLLIKALRGRRGGSRRTARGRIVAATSGW